MRHLLADATNRSLAYVAIGFVAVILGVQAVFFAIWGNDGDPPNAAIAMGFVLFWGSLLGLVLVAVEAVRRRRSSRRRSD